VTDTTTCPTCAATLPAAAVFCTNCGARLGGAPPVPASAPPPPPVDPTRVDNPGLTDPTQAYAAPPPAPGALPFAPAPPPPAPSAPWQPASDTSGPWAGAPTAPPAPADTPAWVHAAQALSTAPPPPTTAVPPVGGFGGPASAPAPGPGGSPGGSPAGAILALVGGVLTLVGTFLPWVTNNLTDAGLSGWDLTSGDKGFRLPDGTLLTFESLDPYVLVALGALSLFVGVMSFGAATRKVARLLAVVSGLAVIGLLVRDWTSLASVVSDKAPVGFEVESAIGFYLAIAGGGLTALSALMPSKS
jgi:hypothetical protein